MGSHIGTGSPAVRRSTDGRGYRPRSRTFVAVELSPVLYRVVTQARPDLGSLEQDFVDRLVEDMSSFLLGGRAWTVERVNHEDRVVFVRDAPRGMKPSWGGFLPQMLGFDLCQRIRQLLVEDTTYPYADAAAAKHLSEQRADLGD